MKKLFLLLSATCVVGMAGAQQVKSIMLAPQTRANAQFKKIENFKPTATLHSHAAANKTTNGATGAWFSFQDANNSGSANYDFLLNYPDSTLYSSTATPPFYWWCHGLGTAFDPTSRSFYQNWLNPNLTPPDFEVDTTKAYTVDSVEVIGLEYRHFTTDVDTLYIEIAPAAQEIYTHDATLPTEGISEDTILRLPEPYYTPDANNIMTSPNVVRITKILDETAANDTTAGGINDWVMEIPGGIQLAAGQHLVAFTHFAPQTRVALGTDIDSANVWRELTYDLARPFLQSSGDYNAGLIAETGVRYNTQPITVDNGAHYCLYPTYYFTSPLTAHDPYYNFHLVCPTCNPVSVSNVNKNITSVNAYPNPAISQVSIPFTLGTAADVRVTLTNVLGQVVSAQSMGHVANGTAVFNTSALASGVYVYTLYAGGERTTGRVVVAH